mmetsp:Transcript_3231/g.7503  ORF Transcript_3231/g.7503 Transcript_3231/m.7503 type:complete len:225 (+) Transcript_3231:1382-2056(+)
MRPRRRRRRRSGQLLPLLPGRPPDHRLGQALHVVLALLQEHDGHSGDLADAPLQVRVARRHDVALVLPHALAYAVVRVRPRVRAGQADEAGVLGHPQRHPVLLPQLLELRHDAVGDVRHALRVQAVHHALDEVDLVLDGKVDEVCVHNHVVGRAQRGVVLEEHRRGRRLNVFQLGLIVLPLLALALVLVNFCILGVENPLHLRELLRLGLVLPHGPRLSNAAAK